MPSNRNKLTQVQYEILVAIKADSQNGSNVYGRKIADDLGISTYTIYNTIERLEKLGLIYKQCEKEDSTTVKRPQRIYLYLTQEGENALSERTDANIKCARRLGLLQ